MLHINTYLYQQLLALCFELSLTRSVTPAHSRGAVRSFLPSRLTVLGGTASNAYGNAI